MRVLYDAVHQPRSSRKVAMCASALKAGLFRLGRGDPDWKLVTRGLSHTNILALAAGVSHASELLKVGDPFRVMQTAGLSGSFFGQNKAFMEKFTALYAKLPQAPPLRTETQTSMTGGPVVNDARSIQEVTAIHPITAADDLFKIPADYKQIEFPFPNPGAGPPG